MTTYAWSRIEIGMDVDKNTGVAEKAQYKMPGEEVTPADLHCDGEDDPQWKEFLNSGAVREYPYPDLPANYQDSPISFIKNQLRAVEEAAMSVSGYGINASLMQQAMTGPIRPPSPDGEPMVGASTTETSGGQTPPPAPADPNAPQPPQTVNV